MSKKITNLQSRERRHQVNINIVTIVVVLGFLYLVGVRLFGVFKLFSR